jgi:two-component system, response regulator
MKSLPRVLLVEDDPNDLELALLAFQRGGVASHVDVARDGAEALEYVFREGRHADLWHFEVPSVVLLDVKLPLVDGIEVLRRIKAEPTTHRIPIVMLTSSAQDRDLQACYQFGANSYIVKPVEMERFFTAIREIGLYWLELNQPDVG